MSGKPWHIELFNKCFGLITIKKKLIFAKVLVLILFVIILLQQIKHSPLSQDSLPYCENVTYRLDLLSAL